MNDLRSSPIVRLALVRPITMFMLFASVLVLGAIAFVNIPLELIPRGVTAPFMSVDVPYDNATSRDVEEKITRPLEEAVATMPQVKRIFSTSSASRSRVNIEFEGDADMDRAYLDLRDRIQRVRPDLPDDVDSVNIEKHSTDGMPVALYGVSWDPSVQNPRDRIRRFLLPQLERIEGVGLIQAMGNDDREIRIEVDRERSEAANLNIFEVAQRLGASHFTLASGQLEEHAGKYLLRSVAEFHSAEELESVIVGANGLRLGDVARVVYDYPEVERYHRYRGRPLMALFVFKESEANTSEVAAQIDAAFAIAKADPLFADFEFETYFSQATQIKSSLDQVFESGIQGGLLAFVVLGFFLQRIRLTLVIALSIPLSMFMALPVMYFTGQSINMVSLLGLMICIGLVVDNAVVIAENIARHRNAGMGRYLSALHGASEVALPITLATATTMVVFLPAALLSAGMTQIFMVQMVTPICVSLLGSLFIALLLIPMASVHLLQDDFRERFSKHIVGRILLAIDDGFKRSMRYVYERTVDPLANAYIRILRVSLRRRIDVCLVVIAAMMSLQIPFHPEHGVKSSLGDGEGGRQTRVTYSIPSNVSLEDADAFFRSLEGWFNEHRKEYGIDGEFIEISREFSSVTVFYLPPKSSDRPLEEIGSEMFEAMPCPPGWTKRSQAGQSDGERDQIHRVYVYGDAHEVVQDVKDAVEAELVKLPGVLSVAAKQRDTTRRDELALRVDPLWSERLGVDASMVGNTVAYALRGSPLPEFQGPDGEIKVWIRYEKADREQLRDVMQFRVPSRKGEAVTLSTLAKPSVQLGDSVLTRNQRRVTAVVELQLDPENRSQTQERIQRFLRHYRVPEGVSFDDAGEAREVDEQQRDMLFGMALGAVLIFLIMGFLFESFVLPLSVLPAIPLSFVGVGWTLYLSGGSIDPLVIIGLMLLMGVVVNNAIVLIDFVNEARSRGMDRAEAILHAGQHRFRPILMTSLTTIGGMIPLAFSDAPAEGIAYAAFGKTLVGGLVSSTLLTLFVVPWAYTLFDDLRSSVMSWAARTLGRRNKAR